MNPHHITSPYGPVAGGRCGNLNHSGIHAISSECINPKPAPEHNLAADLDVLRRLNGRVSMLRSCEGDVERATTELERAVASKLAARREVEEGLAAYERLTGCKVTLEQMTEAVAELNRQRGGL
jgi:hypothetical protein